MSTITDLLDSTPVTTAGAAAIINNNFDNLNTDKIETSYLDIDTTLSANSDSKIATQKAVKAYIDSGGNPNASTTQAGIVEEATQAELIAGTQTGSTTARLFLNPVHTVLSSSGASDSGKIPRLNSSGVLDTSVTNITKAQNYPVVENMDGTTTPVPVCVNASGNVQKADANLSGFDKFIGFCKDNITTAETVFINASQGGVGSTLSFTANAGTNRVAIVYVGLVHTSLTPTLPSGVTYNGNPMTLIDSIATAKTAGALYYYALGTNLSNDVAVNIIQTGAGNYTDGAIQALNYGYVNQSTPVGQKVKNSGSSANPNGTLNPDSDISMIVNAFSWFAGSVSSRNDGQTSRLSTAFAGDVSDVSNRISNSVNYDATTSSSNNWVFQAIELKTPTLPTSDIQYTDTITFPSLTPNAKYYLQDAIGTIGTTPGSTSVLLGKALTSNKLFIIQN